MWMMITYRVKPESVEKHLELHAEVYRALQETQPPGLRELTFQLEDKVSFVSLIEADAFPVPGTAELPAFQAAVPERQPDAE